jgi:hypothetical protein
MQTGTIFSGIGHAGLILWVLVGDWLFPASPPEEIIATRVSLITSDQFAALQAATPTPAEEPAPVRPQARPEEVVEPEPEPEPEPVPEPEPEPVPEPEPEPEPVPEPEPEPTPPPASDVTQAETEQAFESTSTEINPTPEAAEIVAPSPVEVETETETSDTPTPAVSDQPSDVVVEQETQTEETVAEDTGDVLETEANREQDQATGMTTSIRPRTRPEELPEPEVAAAAPEEPLVSQQLTVQRVDDPATEDAIAALLEEVAEPVAEDTAEETAADTGGQDLPQGPPLTGGEMGDISSSIARKWNLGAASTDTMSTMIVVRVSFGPDGKPTDFELLEAEGPTQTGIDKLYESARRAVNRAHADGGLPLPADKYDTWRVLDLVFDANGMRLR